jgi:hypothetical protein
MIASKASLWRGLAAAGITAMVYACGGSGGGADGGAIPVAASAKNDAADVGGPSISLADYGPNTVSRWAEVATATVLVPSTPQTGSPQERRVFWPADLASVHVAMYDAAVAFTRTHEPFFVEPQSPTQGASADAAVLAAGYGVLLGLFPNRTAVYQSQYAELLSQLPVSDEARALGVALGQEVAAGVLAQRGGEDGRSIVLPAFVPGTGLGEYRGPIFANRFSMNIKPFAIERADQFRADGPPALTSDTYAADFAEVRDLGRSDSPLRTPEQTQTALFHTEAANVYLPQNSIASPEASRPSPTVRALSRCSM